MEIIEVSALEYGNHINSSYHIFNSSEFNDLNKEKCEKIFYLLFKDAKIRLGIIVGLKNDELFSPFSAPFGGFSYLNEDVKIQQVDDAIELLRIWILSKGYKSIYITLPPFIYNESFLSKQLNLPQYLIYQTKVRIKYMNIF